MQLLQAYFMWLHSLVLSVAMEVCAPNLFYIVGKPQEIVFHDSYLKHEFELLTKCVPYLFNRMVIGLKDTNIFINSLFSIV